MRQLGKIFCQERNNHDDAPWVILFHGYGADSNDLASLGEMIPGADKLNWLFPNGNLEVPIGPGWTGRAWWPINMMEIQQAAARGEHRDLADEKPPGMEKVRDLAFEMIRQMKVPWNKIILGGFSQGSMLATELYLRAPESPAGLVILSGTLLNQKEWSDLATKRAGETFFQSHGQSDPVLGFKQAQKLETVLTQNGMKGSLIGFKGGHEIPMPILQKLGVYLQNRGS